MNFSKLKYSDLEKLGAPTYIFSKKQMSEQYSRLRSSLPDDFDIFYSLKANANIQVTSYLKELGVRADVASLGELKIAFGSGFPAHEIECTGPGKTRRFLEYAIQNKIYCIVVESVDELILIESISESLQMKAQIAIRIQPDSYFNPNGKQIVSAPSQFGVEQRQVPEFFAQMAKCKNVDFLGFHVFTQSQILKSEILIENFRKSFECIQMATKPYGKPIQFMNLGGGFGISYYEKNHNLDLPALKKGLLEIHDEIKRDTLLSSAKIYVESGRYLVGPAGIYVARIEYVKQSHEKNIAVLSGGLSHHLAACGFGQVIRRNFNMSAVRKGESADLNIYTLAGPSCYSLDVLATDIPLPTLEVGDFICIESSGAYGASFSPGRFLQFESPDEILLEDQ